MLKNLFDSVIGHFIVEKKEEQKLLENEESPFDDALLNMPSLSRQVSIQMAGLDAGFNNFLLFLSVIHMLTSFLMHVCMYYYILIGPAALVRQVSLSLEKEDIYVEDDEILDLVRQISQDLFANKDKPSLLIESQPDQNNNTKDEKSEEIENQREDNKNNKTPLAFTVVRGPSVIGVKRVVSTPVEPECGICGYVNGETDPDDQAAPPCKLVTLACQHVFCEGDLPSYIYIMLFGL